MKHPVLPKTSELIQALIDELQLEHEVTVGKLLERLETRSYGLLLLIFALPSILPFSVVPGFSLLLAIPLFFLSVQLMMGRDTIWLPKWLKNKHLGGQKFVAFLRHTVPYVGKMEKMIKPRLPLLTSKMFRPLFGAIITLLALLLSLPIPLSNAIFGILIAFLALGLCENDGLLLGMGGLASVLLLLVFFNGFWRFIEWIMEALR